MVEPHPSKVDIASSSLAACSIFMGGSTMKEEMTLLKNKLDRYKSACSDLEWLLTDKIADIKYIPSIRVMIKKFKSTQEKTQKKIDLFRKSCKHNFEYTGHGHNYNFYDCINCGETEER